MVDIEGRGTVMTKLSSRMVCFQKTLFTSLKVNNLLGDLLFRSFVHADAWDVVDYGGNS